jgi:CHASE3 domain sensor protein
MTEIDDAMAPFMASEIKEHQAALIRQMVVIGVIICVMLLLVVLHQ